MVVRLRDAKKYPFWPLEEDEEILDPKVLYLSAIRALVYLTNCTRLNIVFAVNFLARYSLTSTKRHWNEIKYILCYLCGTTKMRLFYSGSNSQLIGYANARYLYDPRKGRSQTCYLFTYKGTAISWRSVKQTLMATSFNHS